MSMIERMTIKDWSVEERPREKLVKHGTDILTNAELIAILLGSGSRQKTAVEVAQELLNTVDNSLSALAKRSMGELSTITGIGLAKAVKISAALELGRRRASAIQQKLPRIMSSRDVVAQMRPYLIDLTYEECWLLMLNQGNFLLDKKCISRGGISATVVDQRLIFKQALQLNATSIILVHNHPSGNHAPSESDIRITKRLYEASKIMEIPLRDHVVISENGHSSMADLQLF